MNKHPEVETPLIILFAYAAYLLAEGAGLSGIVSILFCGIVMAHYTRHNLSKASKVIQILDLFKSFPILILLWSKKTTPSFFTKPWLFLKTGKNYYIFRNSRHDLRHTRLYLPWPGSLFISR